MTITTEIIFDVAKMIGDMISSWIRIDWLDRLIREIQQERECQELVQRVNTLRVQVKERRNISIRERISWSRLKRSYQRKTCILPQLRTMPLKSFQVLVPQVVCLLAFRWSVNLLYIYIVVKGGSHDLFYKNIDTDHDNTMKLNVWSPDILMRLSKLITYL